MLRLVNGIASLLQAVFMGPESVLQSRMGFCTVLVSLHQRRLRWHSWVALGSWLCGLWKLASAEDGWCHVFVEVLRASLGMWRQQ